MTGHQPELRPGQFVHTCGTCGKLWGDDAAAARACCTSTAHDIREADAIVLSIMFLAGVFLGYLISKMQGGA